MGIRISLNDPETSSSPETIIVSPSTMVMSASPSTSCLPTYGISYVTGSGSTRTVTRPEPPPTLNRLQVGGDTRRRASAIPSLIKAMLTAPQRRRPEAPAARLVPGVIMVVRGHARPLVSGGGRVG
jgi:hypothetical protein